MIATMTIPKTHVASGILMTGFGHIWEPIVPRNPTYSKNSLPPPFEAFGEDALWKLQQCDIKHEGACHDYTSAEAKKAQDKKQLFLKQFNVLFGITRNKKFAAELRSFKKQEKEDEEREDEEEKEKEKEDEESSESESEFEQEEEEREVDDGEDDDEEEDKKVE
jgi:hypothetical protein